ncbi:pyruvate dehydrogenase [Sphingobium sp. 22B]|uniref:thiamine pyrophosphate-dependent dehydrogenase E1 component subunit alpha n=1 Tax=unclassified Sphingobium TaxID=2611147 RepID=UPI00078320FE|nr:MULTISPECIES: thiamine pyrophosphate-dependent dehydrogenase E1 component subunit alpha [unclassified Sphingobium]KXU33800.1 pyruvate dehydrogenase [Sphingobium sp. AM]KYC33745.1 pyruvate dehydrogenase [Sphingobium sp. 22B]OAP33484.1 pyruvate dehydrogenase [Sphingobium sp. 20006FA]
MEANFPTPDGATLLEIYRKATLIRQNDDRAHKVIRSGRLVMPFYSTKGQEIIPSAVSVNLRPDDYLCTIYRGLHDSLAKGLSLKKLWAELGGRATGSCKGKGGPMHITDPSAGIMVTTGIVGSTMPIANGLGWASRLAGNGRVTIANFGDGASNIGAFHESLNLASVWKLPVIFICQNNRYAEHTAYATCTAVEKVSTRALGYTMPGYTVDGNDPDEMYGTARIAIERARAGEGPTLIEAITYRHNGHVYGDDGSYRDREELAAAIAADPVPRLRARLIAEGIASEDQLSAIEEGFERELDEAVDAALAAPFPALDELKRDIFANEIG